MINNIHKGQHNLGHIAAEPQGVLVAHVHELHFARRHSEIEVNVNLCLTLLLLTAVCLVELASEAIVDCTHVFGRFLENLSGTSSLIILLNVDDRFHNSLCLPHSSVMCCHPQFSSRPWPAAPRRAVGNLGLVVHLPLHKHASAHLKFGAML